MFLKLLVSLCGVVPSGDTLDVATVSSQRNAAVASLSPVRSITEAKIERLGTIGLHEVVNQFSGVSIKDYGGIGGLKTVSVRNMGAAHTAVIYDGIAISDAQNGQVDISRFNLDDISRVSMSIGVSDNIFCSARHLASAGVLKLETAAPTFENGPTEATARLSVGSFGTYNPYISVKRRLREAYALKISGNGMFSNGGYPFMLQNGGIESRETRINSDVRSYGAEADFHADWEDSGHLKAKVNYLDSERGLPGPVILYTQNAYERLRDRSILTNVMYDRSFDCGLDFHADAGYTYSFNRHLDTDPAYPSPQDSRYTQNEYSLAARGLYTLSPGWKIAVAEDVFINSLSSNIPECPFPVRMSSATAVSTQYEGRYLKATVSILGTYMKEKLGSGESTPSRQRLSPMAGISWNFADGFFLRASFKEGFRVPTFNDLYYARVGNTALKPEVARQTNLGMTFSGTFGWGSLDISADGYYNHVKDKIVAVPTMFIWKMRNVGEVAMYGGDFTAAALWKVCDWLSINVSGNYSLQYALDITDPSAKNYRHQIPYTPRHCGSGAVVFETPYVNISYRTNASGKRYIKNQNIRANEIEGYSDHCVSVNRVFILERHSLYVGLEGLNLGGRNYEVIHSYPMPGRSFRCTLKYGF
jgi:outer membrane cobalamin receptor